MLLKIFTGIMGGAMVAITLLIGVVSLPALADGWDNPPVTDDLRHFDPKPKLSGKQVPGTSGQPVHSHCNWYWNMTMREYGPKNIRLVKMTYYKLDNTAAPYWCDVRVQCRVSYWMIRRSDIPRALADSHPQDYWGPEQRAYEPADRIGRLHCDNRTGDLFVR